MRAALRKTFGTPRISRRLCAAAALLVLIALHPFAAGGGKNIFTNVAISNPRYPGFNDDGHLTTLLTGEQATYVSERQIDIRALAFTQYPGDGSSIVQARITAPSASVFLDAEKKGPRISGRDTVHLVQENELDATGENWAYDHAQKKLNLNKNARITYNAPLKNILGTPATSEQAAPETPQSEIAPTLITADSLELTQNETDGTTLAILNGNVAITTADGLRLYCDHLEVTASRLRDKDPKLQPADKFQLLVATGNVRLMQGERTVTCGRADVFPREDRITLTHTPVVTDAGLRIEAASDPLTLHRTNRRIEGKRAHFTLPPWVATKDKKTPAAPPSPEPENTIITANNYVMWETPDGLTHVTLDEQVTVTATDTRLVCDHLELIAKPEKQKTETKPESESAPDAAKPIPLHHLLATGNVHITQGTREATCGAAEVLPHEDRITLTQNPVLTDHKLGAVATGDVFVLRQLDRNLTGQTINITLPPLKDLSATAKTADDKKDSAYTPTTIASDTLTMWTTADEISHATFENNVRLAATNLDLTCNHLTVDADPSKPAPQPDGTDSTLDPKLQLAATKTLSMIATHAVRFTQLNREATCERAEIIPPEDRITLTGSPRITERMPDSVRTITGENLTLIRGQGEISGDKIKITSSQ